MNNLTTTMNERKEKFCEKCGSLLAEHLIGRFSKYTGEQKRELHCTNLFCEEGCKFHGHIWGKVWKLENWEKCQRCGYVIWDIL